MRLIIAEKRSVAASIASALGATSRADGFYEGNDLLVSWCVGHLVSPMDAAGYDPSFRKWHFEDLPILPEPFRYVLAPGKEAAFENLRALMDRPDVDTIVNACDAGREGELIFRLVYEMAGCRKPVRRLWISSMEDNAIRDGFSDLRPGADYEALYQSALCRQKADWLVGINATRLFSVLYHRTLNVGRVLTPTLAMLVERERKISQFKEEKYYVLRLEMNGTEAVSEKLNDSTEVERAAAACKGVPAICTSVTKEQKKEQPPKLYDLTTLQREANRLLGYTAKQTLDYAQSLYEKKLLTYPRTDSRYLTSDMAETASCVIHLAAKLPPFDSCSNFFPLVEAMISDKNVSDHHAIIPTMEIEKADIKALPLGERNLFLLVCCKLLCASAEPYVYEAVTATFSCGGQSFTAKGKRILSEGWQEIDRIFRASLKETPMDKELLLLTDEEKKDWAEDLAVQFDSFFRDFDRGYAEKYPEKRSQVAAFYDWLIDGKVAFLESRLKDLGQTEQDALYSDLQDYKKLTAYDPALDDQPKAMQILVVEPRKAPCLREVEESDFHSILGGDYSVTHPFGPEVAVLCREDGRESGLEWNRALYNGRGQVYDVIAGTFLVAGMDGDKITSLPDDLANKYNRRFQTIEVYAQVGDRTVMFQVPQDNLSDFSDRDLDSILRAKLEKRPSLRDRLNAAKEECVAQAAPERDLSHAGPER